MTDKKPETIADRPVKSTWCGRSLDNFKQQHREKHPEVVTAKTLTKARILVFGEKTRRAGVCQCKQATCQRYGRGKSSHC